MRADALGAAARATTARATPRPVDEPFTLCLLDDVTWVVTAPTGLSGYDMTFAPRFTVRHPARLEREVVAIARMGATAAYEARYEALRARGIRLVHTPAMYRRTSLLPEWYPRLEGLTPRSCWFDAPPEADEVGARLGWPVFVKGARQTSRHRKSLCVAESPDAFAAIMRQWRHDEILAWQPVVCRAWVALRRVAEPSRELLPVSYEFRSFWYRGELVGVGPWWPSPPYALDARECEAALAVGAEAARRVGAPFLVVDLAQTADGAWIVIECNDGQDAGYCGVDRVALWQRVVAIDRARAAMPGA